MSRPAHARTFVAALRVYLRFLATNGACQPGLDHALPTAAEWKLSSLRRYLNDTQANCLIDSCRPDGPQGLRDHAIVLLLLRLGLRAGDIANIRPAERVASSPGAPAIWSELHQEDIGDVAASWPHTGASRKTTESSSSAVFEKRDGIAIVCSAELLDELRCVAALEIVTRFDWGNRFLRTLATALLRIDNGTFGL